MTEVLHASAYYARQTIAECWDEAESLILANQRETGSFDPSKFAPNPAVYLDVEKRGLARLYTMRHAGKLTGYQVLFVAPHPRYHGVKVATQDVLYVAPDHRGIASANFIRYADGDLERDGYHILRHVSEKNDWSGLLLHLGYKRAEQTFEKAVK